MAEGQDAEDRSEAPTQRRLDKAREQGQVPVSREAATFATLLAATLAGVLTLPAAGLAWLHALQALLEAPAPDAAAALGLSRKAFALARDYGVARKVGGAPIFANQGVTFPLADALTRMHAAELMIRNAACLADAGRPFRLETSMTKLFASELAGEIAELAVQIHGGYGVFEEYDVSGLIGEAKVLQIVEGTSEIQRLIIARELS